MEDARGHKLRHAHPLPRCRKADRERGNGDKRDSERYLSFCWLQLAPPPGCRACVRPLAGNPIDNYLSAGLINSVLTVTKIKLRGDRQRATIDRKARLHLRRAATNVHRWRFLLFLFLFFLILGVGVLVPPRTGPPSASFLSHLHRHLPTGVRCRSR